MRRRRRGSETILGIRVSVISSMMIGFGIIFCFAYAFIDHIFLAQFGVMSVLAGMDIALMLHEGRCGRTSEDVSR
ncbi:hypothetical protein J2T05_004252 [Cupriavidus necator]|nr:hypothetical protein [Cupriavidus necator]